MGGRGCLGPVVLVVGLVLAGCGADDGTTGGPSPATSSPVAPAPPPTSAAPTAPVPSERPRARWVRGIDASHHQGDVDWEQVAADDVDFAYLKASEGSSFSDPRFVDHVAAARAARLRVGGYHYFTLCSPGVPQAEHFLATLRAAGRTTLPPAVDLELQGQCDAPPERDALLAEVRAFLDVVERGTGRSVVVYAFPDLEAAYRLAGALDRRQWVRRLGDVPPERAWWIWQRADDATVDGVDGPVDLNLARAPGPPTT